MGERREVVVGLGFGPCGGFGLFGILGVEGGPCLSGQCLIF